MAPPSVSARALLAGSVPSHPGMPTTSPSTLNAMYDAWFESVLRWTRALGAPAADREDIAQDVFLVVRRRLHAFDGENPAAWLYRITKRQVRDFRRRSWIKNIFTREHTNVVDTMPDDRAGPVASLERKQTERILLTLLSKMNPDRRAAFMLFELEGLTGEEIARIQGVAVTTVWKRLHFARKEFLQLVERYQRGFEAGGR